MIIKIAIEIKKIIIELNGWRIFQIWGITFKSRGLACKL
jgi:hypothetical protein